MSIFVFSAGSRITLDSVWASPFGPGSIRSLRPLTKPLRVFAFGDESMTRSVAVADISPCKAPLPRDAAGWPVLVGGAAARPDQRHVLVTLDRARIEPTEQGISDRPACQGRGQPLPLSYGLLLPRRAELGGSSRRTHGRESGRFSVSPDHGRQKISTTLSARVLLAMAPAKPWPLLSEKARIDCSHDANSGPSAEQTTPTTNSIYQV